MSCSNCGKKSKVEIKAPDAGIVPKSSAQVVGKSETPAKTVRLRYYGGGIVAKKKRGCSTCGGAKNSYSRITNETIAFASEDEPNGLFMQAMQAGHDYWVTEKQAEYLLNNELYTAPSGEVVHKFKRMN